MKQQLELDIEALCIACGEPTELICFDWIDLGPFYTTICNKPCCESCGCPEHGKENLVMPRRES